MDLTFEWDEKKARENWRKHRVRFEEAKTVFFDPRTVTITDPEHSTNEDRFIDIGTSSSGRVLVVMYTERGEQIRLISSRKASAREREVYNEGRI